MIKITFQRSFAFAVCVFASLSLNAQFAFTNANTSTGLTSAHSGNAVTVVDVNNDGLDDIVKMDQSSDLHVELQQRDGTFDYYNLGAVTGGSNVWGMACADVDHNGWKDVATGTNGTMYLVKLFWSGSTITKTQTTLAGSYFVQSITFGDFNNDGWSDLFVCDDNAYAKVYMNNSGTLSLIGISTNSMSLTTGSKSFTIQTGLTFTVGQTVKVGHNAGKYMTGTVTAFNSGTGAMTVNVTSVVGTGTQQSWSVDPNIVFNNAYNSPTTMSGDPADSGNYGSVWTDFDNDGDLDLFIPHCRQSASSSTDLRRKDRMFVNNGSNLYTEASSSYNIEVTNYKQTWTASFGDIDNDGDFDLVTTNHGQTGEVFENNGSGMYTLLPSSGYTTSIDPIESVLADFDNDGYLDILITEQGNYFWHNNGDKTFTAITGLLPNLGGMLSFATGDLNHDGFIDLYTSYGNVYNSPGTDADVLYMNNGNSNHFITFNLTGTASNHDAIGAKVTITGSFGTQVREVRAGESYGTANSMQCHFGLGAATGITSAVIEWPAGGTSTFGALSADQFVTVVEGTCSIVGNTIPGPYVTCSSGSLTATAGFSSYLWNTGATTASIGSLSTGDYNVLVTNGACSNLSPTVHIDVNPDETPSVSLSGANSCPGVATLTSTAASSYSWTGPSGFTATTQSINPPQSGNYTVTINGLCTNWSSAPYNITLLGAAAPTGTGASGPGPASFTLGASGAGTVKNWYDLATGGTLLGTGTSYNTPVISTTTTYYVDDQFTYAGPINSTGQATHTGGSLYSATNINGGIDFNVTATCTLVSVDVINNTPTTAGTREIQLKNSGGTTINSLVVNITGDQVVTLNWVIPPGTGYRLTTNAALNNTNFSHNSPDLQRSSSGVTYPMSIAGVISLTNGWTGTATTASAYYYFYDWKVQSGSTVCTSPRTAVTATVTTTTGITAATENNGIQIYPNPATDEVNITFQAAAEGRTTVELVDITGRIVRTAAIENATAGQNIRMDVNDLSAGSYTVNIKSDTRNLIQKLVLTK